MSTENFFESLQRTFEVANCNTQDELALFLGVRQSAISDARRKKAIPCEWLLKLLTNHHINPEWILTGDAPRFIRPSCCRPDVYSLNPLKEVPTRHLLDELRERMEFREN